MDRSPNGCWRRWRRWYYFREIEIKGTKSDSGYLIVAISGPDPRIGESGTENNDSGEGKAKQLERSVIKFSPSGLD
jgi:hypothetical protein